MNNPELNFLQNHIPLSLELYFLHSQQMDYLDLLLMLNLLPLMHYRIGPTLLVQHLYSLIYNTFGNIGIIKFRISCYGSISKFYCFLVSIQ